MPKSMSCPIRMYFDIQEKESAIEGDKPRKIATCKICACPMQGNHASNMERHVRRGHPEVYERYLILKKASFDPIRKHYDVSLINLEEFGIDSLGDVTDPLQVVEVQKNKIKNVKKIVDSPTVSGRQLVSNTSIKNALLELVTTNGRPLSLLKDSGFQCLLNLASINIRPPMTVTEELLTSWVSEKAQYLRLSIIERLKGKAVSIKLDLWSCNRRSFIGVNVYWYSKGTIQSFLLKFIEVGARIDDMDYCELIWKELAKFGITQNQVYSFVIDSGSNFLEDISIENECFVDLKNSSDTADATLNSTSFCNTENNDCSDGTVQIITLFNDCEEEEIETETNMIDLIASKLDFGKNDDESTIFDMKCISDNLQMAVNDALKSSEEIINLVKEIRSIYNKLNITVGKSKLSQNFSLSANSKWKYLYSMLDKLQTWNKLGVMYEDDNFRHQAEILLQVLKPCNTASLAFQKQDITIGDVFKLWYNCILETSKINYSFAKILVEHMKSRQEELFKNHIFLASIFLDPRFNNMVLNSEHKRNAIQHLLLVHQKFCCDNENDDSIMDYKEEEEDELEKIFQEQETTHPKDGDIKSKYAYTEIILKTFCDSEPRLKTTENIMNFWEKKKIQYPDIYNLARTLFSVPAAQKSMMTTILQAHYCLNNGTEHSNIELFDDIVLLRANAEDCS